MEWHPAGLSVCLPLLSSLAPRSPEIYSSGTGEGSPGKTAVKRLCVRVCDIFRIFLASKASTIDAQPTASLKANGKHRNNNN